MTDVGELQLMVAADEELPPEEILQLCYLPGYCTRSDAQLGGSVSATA
jgi:hypothetical protein